jgi:hypothetical protein
MSRHEVVVGHLIASILVVIWIYSILMSIWNIIFWQEGANILGHRDQIYLSE